MQQSSIDERLSGIERAQRKMLTYLVRLEDRLEKNEVLKDAPCGNAELRYALEHGVPIDVHQWDSEELTQDFADMVSAWMQAHEDDENATFTKLLVDFGANKTGLLTMLNYFAISGQWEDVLRRFCSDPQPSELKRILKRLDEDNA